MKRLVCIVAMCVIAVRSVDTFAQECVSALNKKEFHKHWVIESESPDYSVSFIGDTVELISPKGLTMWRRDKFSSDVIIEYDACIVNEGKECDRTSDLNCFWLASDPKAKDVFQRMAWRGGVFLNSYSMSLYYMGYGGNYNGTTRFRRYEGNDKAITNANLRPAILTEYTDSAHLLKPNHWYHIKLMQHNGRVMYFIDGKCLVSYLDPQPLTEGWFGFRTTWSRARMTNFKVTKPKPQNDIPLSWIGEKPTTDMPVSWGIPFAKGELTDAWHVDIKNSNGKQLTADNHVMARWQDGSIKWLGLSTVATPCDTLYAVRTKGKANTIRKNVDITKPIDAGRMKVYISAKGANIIDSLFLDNRCVARDFQLFCSVQDDVQRPSHYEDFTSQISNVEVQQGNVKTTVKIEGKHLMPFVVYLYIYKGTEQIKVVHSFTYTADHQKQFVGSLGLRASVPMPAMLYNRHVAFTYDDAHVWTEPVQPLVGRIPLQEGIYERQMRGEVIADTNAFDSRGKMLLRQWASWGDFRLTQHTSEGFQLRKRTSQGHSWVGTFGGHRADGTAYVGGTEAGLLFVAKDFWQSAPTGFEIKGAREDNASLIYYMWSPDAEAMDLRHYDSVPHGLLASYEDVQQGFSTPYGISRTHELTIIPQMGYEGAEALANVTREHLKHNQLICTPQYLHDKRAFGIWSLPDTTSQFRASIEKTLNNELQYYKNAIERHKWYGFWNYGDFMHSYDPVRREWLYDVGGYAWDNTELATNMWLWYSFLRTARADVWQMAKAMSRHTSEVDVYHLGPHAMLGSRHNVSHWGCGAKEARISQAAWNRFYYYLTTDDRTADLMSEVRDAEQMLYTLDPMRLAEPKSKYPCSAPARLRIGPDWLAYAGNWFAQWERTGDKRYYDKIVSGMQSIARLRHGLFTGNKALGFDPATGIISYDGDTALQNTNHLLSIMGGFEIMTEIMLSIDCPEWNKAWFEHADLYKRNAMKISHNKFRVSRLEGLAAWRQRDAQRAQKTWLTMIASLPKFGESDQHYTNDAATWGLDAIYLLEVIGH